MADPISAAVIGTAVIGGAFAANETSKQQKAAADQQAAAINSANATAQQQADELEAEKQRQLDISNLNKTEAYRRRRGGSSLLNGDYTISNSATNTKLGG